ncbi:MAG: cytochrome c [Bacteroidetes bacterium]|nr:MAG: cytochrome c [Bacteroidota bacterium]REK00779.1 MAG: cytochrome c [Bacteroidota bacterium]REK35027.1 MAG: cytochrome c [Bacteroidota bacterium]REK48174.1 MAG: cytochrome c [Bacteroidota bacterium]
MKSNLIITLLVLFGIQFAEAQDGQQLFRDNCSACHSVGEGRLVGPDLKDVHKNVSEKWLISFIKSSQTMIDKKDARAVKVFEEYNQIPMPDQNLSDGEIKAVLAYIKSQSGGESTEAGTIIPASDGNIPTSPGNPAANESAVATSGGAVQQSSGPASSHVTSAKIPPSLVIQHTGWNFGTGDFILIGMLLFFLGIIWYLGRIIVQLSNLLTDKYKSEKS